MAEAGPCASPPLPGSPPTLPGPKGKGFGTRLVKVSISVLVPEPAAQPLEASSRVCDWIRCQQNLSHGAIPSAP